MLEWQFIENMLPVMGCIKQFQQIHFYITTLVMHDFFWIVKFIVNEHVCISRKVLIKLSEGAIHIIKEEGPVACVAANSIGTNGWSLVRRSPQYNLETEAAAAHSQSALF